MLARDASVGETFAGNVSTMLFLSDPDDDPLVLTVLDLILKNAATA
jgi:hypothetical protein